MALFGFLVLSLCCVAVSSEPTSQPTCQPTCVFKQTEGYMLDVVSMGEEPRGLSDDECFAKCLETDRCLSVSIYTWTGVTSCQLNDQSNSTNPEYLVPFDQATYYEKLCDGKPLPVPPCLGFICPSNGACIHREWMCDGMADCPEGEDEYEDCDCAVKCRNGRCLMSSALECNRVDDCGDNSDEEQCDGPVPPCQWFTCPSNGACIYDSLVCDEIVDCPEGEDESEDCPCAIECRNGQCLRRSDLECNGVDDCGDNTDEDTLWCRWLKSTGYFDE